MVRDGEGWNLELRDGEGWNFRTEDSGVYKVHYIYPV